MSRYLSNLPDDVIGLTAQSPLSVSSNNQISISQNPSFTNVNANTINITDTTNSISSTTGALQVLGGVAIKKNLHVVDEIRVGESVTNTRAGRSFNLVSTDAIIKIWRYSNSTVASPSVEYLWGNSGDTPTFCWDTYLSCTDNTYVIRNRTGSNVDIMKIGTNAVITYPTTDSTSSTTGSFQIKGGLGIVKNLFVGGNISCVALTQTSDRRVKEDIVPIELSDSLTKILQLEPKSFKMKSDPEKRKHFGLIAQDLQSVLPELVVGSETFSVNYSELIPHLVNCIKNHQVQIDELKKKKH